MKAIMVEGIKKQPVYFAFVSTLLILAAVVTVVVVVSQDTRTYVSTTTVKGKVVSRPLSTSDTTPILSSTSLPSSVVLLKKADVKTEAPSAFGASFSVSPTSPTVFASTPFIQPPTTTTTIPPNITKISSVRSTQKSTTITTVRATVTSTKGSDFDFVYAFYFNNRPNTSPQTARTKGTNTITADVALGKCESDSFFVVVTWPGGSLTSDSVNINTPLAAACTTTTTTSTTTTSTTAPPTTTTEPPTTTTEPTTTTTAPPANLS